MKDLYLHPDIITSKFMLKTETVQAVCVILSTDQLLLQGARFHCWWMVDADVLGVGEILSAEAGE